MMNEKGMIEFEESIKELFSSGKINAPIHFTGGNEKSLLEIFKEVKENDWVFSTHRSHYHALLKGMDKEWLKNEIINGRSMHINNKEHKFFTSSIVGGILPIAVGVAMALKRKKSKDKVWVFVGDMCAEMGIFYECSKYAMRQNLPIIFVIEDNGMSINTPTQEAWGKGESKPIIIRYQYERVYPHQGCGKWVVF